MEPSASRFLTIQPGTAHLLERLTCGPIGWTAVSDPGLVPPDVGREAKGERAIDTFHADLAEIVEFDERLTALSRLIGSVTRPGDYCVHGRPFAPMPRIEAGAAGVLSFPIPPAQAQMLAADGDRAPYGRGQETIVDPSVRDCRQLEPDKLSVAGRAWADTFADILHRTTVGLGCTEGSVTAELYKLLIYEPGGFFKPHRDTEKADGMVATLVISLPVSGTGGELIVRHRDRDTVVDMRTDEPSELVYTAFYADCEHEILPVTDGHRVCLVYNLMLQEGSGTPMGAPDYGAEIDHIAAELGARCRDPGMSGKLIWLLEHDYSTAGLSFGTLKNVDAAIGRVLTAAAERAGCALHAAIVRVEETGAGWYDGYEDVVEDIADGEFHLEEVVDVECRLDGWARPDGAAADYGALPLLAGELMPAGRLDPERPDSQRLLEASGNEGATIERFYRRTALVMWPNADSASLLAQAGAGSLAAFLAGERQRASADAPACGPIRDLASEVVDLWPPCDSHRRRSEGDSWEGHTARALELLCSIGNREATARFLTDVVLPNYDGEMNGALVTAAAGMGAGEMQEFLSTLAASNLSRRTEGVVDLASRLCDGLDDRSDGAWHGTLRRTAGTICAQLPSVSRPLKRDGLEDWRLRPASTERIPLPVATLRQFFLLLWRFDMEGEADAVASLLIERADLVPPDRTIPALVEALSAEHAAPVGGSAALGALWRHGAGFLLSRSELPPAPPTDWVISAEGLACNCEHCAELRRFCVNPDAEILRMPVRKEVRGHLRRRIEEAGIDIVCETERRGRPYTLVCVKTRGAFERRLRQYEEDVEEMQRLLRTAGAFPGSTDIAETLRDAVGRGC